MSVSGFTVLVIGGYGVFGSRLCRLLAREPGFKVLVAGRSSEKAAALARELCGEAPDRRVEGLCLDLAGDFDTVLGRAAADLVIHVAGPFERQDYRVARACIRHGLHYVDLADGRDFVRGIAALDGLARAAEVLVVSGASSVPGLSGAVIDHLSRGLVGGRDIAIGITPGNRVPRGLGLVSTILGYVGKPLPAWRDGRRTTIHGWQDLCRRTLRLPGLAPLGPRWFAFCDVPDLALVPDRDPGLRSLAFHAGLELTALHIALWLLSWPVRWRLLPSLAPFARLARCIAGLFEGFGSDRGGMFVDVSGRLDRGRRVRRRWTLIAESGDGPFVPCLPAVILARALARGNPAPSGAYPCIGLFGLDDFAAAARGLALHWGEEIRYV